MRLPDIRAYAGAAAPSRRYRSWWFPVLGGRHFCHPQEIAGGAEELRHEVLPIDPALARFAKVASSLPPAKGFLDPLSDALAGSIGLRAGDSTLQPGCLSSVDAGNMRVDSTGREGHLLGHPFHLAQQMISPMSGELSPLSDVSTIRGRPAPDGLRRCPSGLGKGSTGNAKNNPRAGLFKTMKKIAEERK